MWNQSSYQAVSDGKLYIIPTPIGNLEDMTFRAIQYLKEADLIACEDTRQTKKLCNHFEITTHLVSYHEHNKMKSGDKLIEKLKNGQTIAIVSDAGMPGISDPGYELVKQCVEEQIPVIPLPGANAALPALVASGLSTDHFYFYGFLPRDKKSRRSEIELLAKIRDTIILYESPHRLKETLKDLSSGLGNERMASLNRELTKKYEEIIRGKLEDLQQWSEDEQIRGEFCLIIEGSGEIDQSEDLWWASLSVVEHIEHYIEEKEMSNKAAIKQVALDRNLPKREVYQTYHVK
ncbi:16S rRNA (cytidine(1402)-2'-O)-methyltransferase [Pseudalkalibacillus berkeleyi]|uniref:Ribosomal RNA small subunit methyltransferase I n=1 Tax=Pseudalkalibacillus berkeleyi TaxID=1069813 RepID=A0ABS9H6G9_9BACL|nr:16S rRNA (cytidine(1402)-2'-O)-methyltransferase [Pseudalkalibacillus berkeleyi]MCF6139575.1 16S rRNA (cytidine(1402)-2'-O)-methyltransferase [Pseudalkalibacillus berkeleyi]